jgi:hypothetical protein
MCATMLSVSWQMNLSLGRFLHFTKEQSAPQLVDAIDQDCKGAVSIELLRSSIFLVMCFACCFYALFLFDTLGDAVGLSGAAWVLIVVPTFPAVLALALRFWQYCRGKAMLGEREEGNDLAALEMAVRGIGKGNNAGEAVISRGDTGRTTPDSTTGPEQSVETGDNNDGTADVAVNFMHRNGTNAA